MKGKEARKGGKVWEDRDKEGKRERRQLRCQKYTAQKPTIVTHAVVQR